MEATFLSGSITSVLLGALPTGAVAYQETDSGAARPTARGLWTEAAFTISKPCQGAGQAAFTISKPCAGVGAPA
jgi:hypothetical protein